MLGLNADLLADFVDHRSWKCANAIGVHYEPKALERTIYRGLVNGLVDRKFRSLHKRLNRLSTLLVESRMILPMEHSKDLTYYETESV
jgi:hypothetical protein